MFNPAGYRDLKKVAEGMERVIYSAVRDSDQMPVVLKALRSEHPSADVLALMYHEYELSKDLDLPGAIHTYGLIDEQNQYALVQEDMHGISLQEYLHQHPIQNLKQFFTLAIPMAYIVGAVHRQLIIHKDIKPSNFIIDPTTLTEKLTDFNFSSKLLHEVQDVVPPNKLEGTLAYMAPEQTGRMNINIDYRSDFYALGVSFYQMLSGGLPFLFDEPLELLHAHLALPIPEMSSTLFDIPLVLKKIIQKLMAKNPSERYQSAIGLQADLERCQKELENTGKIEDFSLGQEDVFDRLNLSQKLYGRENEVRELLDAYARISEGGVEALMVCGYSGIGKTKLINEVHKPMVKQKGYFISGKFDLLQRNTPYIAITQAFNQLARLILAEPEDRFERIKKSMINALGDNAAILVDLAPDLEFILGPQPPLEQLPAQQTQNRMMEFFRRFMQAIATHEHPLVIFIDDLQWIDSGALKLIEYLMKDEELHHVLLIGAYRSNEVDALHPLAQFLKNMSIEGKRISTLSLSPLGVDDFEALFVDSFHREKVATKGLAELVHKRTGGNPFFCKQVINTLYQEKLLFFHYSKRQWDWNLDGIASLRITDNVVDLMLGKLQALPDETRKLLRYAACIGSRFTVETLILVSGKSGDLIAKALWPALQQELIVTLRLGYKRMDAMGHANLVATLSKDITFQFVHDRVQQAAYQEMTETEKQAIHLSIARLLLEKEPEACQKERLFELTDHFNEAHALLSQYEKMQVMQLNYQAGLRAFSSNAYKPMYNYLQAGVSLTDENGWDKYYELMFNLNRAYAQSFYLNTMYEESAVLTENLLRRAKTQYDKASIYRMQSYIFQPARGFEASLKVILEALNLLGMKIPSKVSMFRVFLKMIQTKMALRHYKIPILDQQLKAMTDKNFLLAFEILTEAYLLLISLPRNLSSYIFIECMRLILRYGSPPSAALWVWVYARTIFFLSESAEECIPLLNVSENFILQKNDKYSTAFQINTFLHFFQPFEAMRPVLDRAFKAALDSGNLYAADVVCFVKPVSILLEAKSLRDTLDSIQAAVVYGRRFKIAFDLFRELTLAIVRSEMETIPSIDLQQDLFEQFLQGKAFQITKTMATQLMSRNFFFLESYELASEYHFEWYKNEAILREGHLTPTQKTLDSLLLVRCIPHLPYSKRLKYWQHFWKMYRYMKRVSKINPHNYKHQYLLLYAAWMGYLGFYKKALLAFDQSAVGAKAGNFYLWVALAKEWAGDLLMTQKLPYAATDYIREAHYYYARYGMMVKVTALEKRYPECFAEQVEIKEMSETKSFPTQQATLTTTTTSAKLDFMSVIKASQALSGEIVLDKLFEKMLHIVLENAGSEKVLFLERNKGAWLLTASLEVHQGQSQFTMLNVILKEFQDLPQAVIQYTLRSKESVVLNHAAEDSQYRFDPYIMRTQPKSVLCLPVIRKDRVLGVIYLENNLTIGAFTQDRVTVLTTLSSQIAISLENARNFEKMQLLYRSTEKFVPKSFLQLLKKEHVEDIRLGDSVEATITVLFTDIRDYTTITEKQTPKEAFSFINEYLKTMGPIIRKNHGFINQYQGDAIMALFPRDPEDGVRAVIEMSQALIAYNAKQRELNRPELKVGYGLNTGLAMLGTIGEEERMDANVISDAVNLGSRVESLNKSYGTKFLISDATYQALSDKAAHVFRLIDKVRVKGKNQALYLYEVYLDPVMDESEKHFIAQYESAFRLYESGDFAKAKALFTQCQMAKPEDQATALFIDRCAEFIERGTPEGWDGTFTLLSK